MNEIANLNYKTRRREIIKYIIAHQGCKKEELYAALIKKGISSKETAFQILKDLIKANIVQNKKKRPNSRDSSLYVDLTNPLVLIPHEFAELSKSISILISRIVELYSKPFDEWTSIKRNPHRESHCIALGIDYEDLEQTHGSHEQFVILATIPYYIIFHIDEIYYFCFTFVYPETVSNKRDFKLLQLKYRSAISKILKHTSNELSKIHHYDTLYASFPQLNSLRYSEMYQGYIRNRMSSPLKNFEILASLVYRYNLEKECLTIFEYFWDKYRNYLPLIYPGIDKIHVVHPFLDKEKNLEYFMQNFDRLNEIIDHASKSEQISYESDAYMV